MVSDDADGTRESARAQRLAPDVGRFLSAAVDLTSDSCIAARHAADDLLRREHRQPAASS
jgi:hypothetical protein